MFFVVVGGCVKMRERALLAVAAGGWSGSAVTGL